MHQLQIMLNVATGIRDIFTLTLIKWTFSMYLKNNMLNAKCGPLEADVKVYHKKCN